MEVVLITINSILNDYTANIQNIYMDEVGYAHTLSKIKNLVASNSIPTYGSSHKLNPSTQKINYLELSLGNKQLSELPLDLMIITSLVVMQSIIHLKKMMMEQFLVFYSVRDYIL